MGDGVEELERTEVSGGKAGNGSCSRVKCGFLYCAICKLFSNILLSEGVGVIWKDSFSLKRPPKLTGLKGILSGGGRGGE